MLFIIISSFVDHLYTLNPTRFPLRVNVGFLLNQPVGSNRTIHFEVDNFALDEMELFVLQSDARFVRTAQGILVQADFTANSRFECVRCLEEIEQPLHTTFNELYAFQHRDVTESDLILHEDANIDLAPLTREYLLLEVPISPLCSERCKGLCPVCGVDLNKATCKHQSDALNNPHACGGNP